MTAPNKASIESNSDEVIFSYDPADTMASVNRHRSWMVPSRKAKYPAWGYAAFECPLLCRELRSW